MTASKHVTMLGVALALAGALLVANQNGSGGKVSAAGLDDAARRAPVALDISKEKRVEGPQYLISRPRLPAMLAMDDTTLIADFTFDDTGGNPDPQGWTSADLTEQSGTFFHIDDFAGVPGYTPLAGSKSLWCGVGPGEPGYATAPGYGTYWDQRFESVSFPAVGTANVSFEIAYDSEQDWDKTTFEYLSATSGNWEILATYDGQGSEADTLMVPAAEHGGSLQLRFRFWSDYVNDDEDGLFDTNGAVVIDNIRVTSDAGLHDDEDFEGEAVGALITTDGDWFASARPAFGDFAGLVDGATVVQEDPMLTNNTNFWSFFNGSPDTYACGGFPGQPAVPFTDYPGSGVPTDYIQNEIRSPWIDVTEDINGMPYTMTENLYFGFDVYRDVPLDNVVFYAWRVRWMVGGQPTDWLTNFSVYPGGDKVWFRHVTSLSAYFPPGATEVQIALQAADYCWVWCGVYGSGSCHSHAPLFDNVSVYHVDEGPIVVTNTNDSGPGSLREAIGIAASSTFPSTIHFDIPGAGPHVIAPLSNLPGLGDNTTLDGKTQPGYSGVPVIEIDGVNTFGVNGLLMGDGCLIRGVSVYGFDNSAIYFAGDDNGVESCYLGVRSDGGTAGNGGNGVYVNGSNNAVGGDTADLGNVIVGNSTGVYVQSGTGNTIRLNDIHGNSGPAIDLSPPGPDTNDLFDADTGANDLQNYPTITTVDIVGRSIQGSLHSTAAQSFTIDIYGGDCTTNREAEVYLATVNVITNFSGNATFAATVTDFPYGYGISATATNAAGSTSEVSSCLATPTPLVVTNTDYYAAVTGRLRDAVTTANANPGLDIIVFDIPGPGPHTMEYSAGGPTLTDPVVIDGYTQPGSSPNTNPIDQPCNAVLQIILTAGFNFQGGNSLIRGINIEDQTGTHIALSTLGGNRVEGCFIGLDVTGTTAVSNSLTGVASTSPDNVIGGPLPGQRNLISGHGNGVYLVGPGATNNEVQGNFIGTDITGTVGLGNSYGVRVTGTDNLVGGSSSSERNVIFATYHGVSLTDEDADNNTVNGNYIGLDRTGTALLAPVPTGSAGIALSDGDNNVIGGSSPSERNVCAGQYYGMWLFTNADGNTIINNYFGTDVTGTIVHGFGSYGILSTATGTNNEIGGINPGEGNIFAGSAGPGIGVNLGSVRIRGNSIFDNAELGIDNLEAGIKGVTANDAGDVDTGPNELQNFPDISSAELQGGGTHVIGSLSSMASTTYWVEFFASDACDPSGYGEGKSYLGGANVLTDGAGVGAFDLMLPTAGPDGWWITGTATDPNGNTSEFSACVQSINTPGGMNVAVTPVDPGSGENPITLTFDDVSSGGNTTLTITDTGPPPPNGFTFGDETTFYDLDTDATYSGNIEVCIEYDENALTAPEEDLVLLHYDTTLDPDDWVDVTTTLDIDLNILCGVVTSLSPFALAAADGPTGVGDDGGLPQVFALYQNHPNPFNPTTTIRYDVPAGGARVELAIYDVAGRRIRTLVNRFESAGAKRVTWDARNERGAQVATGIYFYRMTAGHFVQTRKMLLLK